MDIDTDATETKKLLTRTDLIIQSFKFHGQNVLNEYLGRYKNSHSAEDALNIAFECVSAQTHPFPPIIAKFHEFLIDRSPYIFDVKDDVHNLPIANSDAFQPSVSLTELLDISNKERLQLFFRTLKQYDVIVGEIFIKEESCFQLTVLCFTNGKSLIVDSLRYLVFLPVNKIKGNVEVGTLVQVAFFGCDIPTRKFLVTADEEDVKSAFAIPPKLGIITEDELPAYYKLAKKGCGYELDENKFLKSHTLGNMLAAFNIDKLPLFPDKHDTVFRPEYFASHIKVKQQHQLSNMNYQLGNQYAYEGKSADGLKHYSLALELNPHNIDALFSQGCLYIKMKNFTKGIKKLEQVLKLKPSHENAKAYLSAAFVTQLSITSNQKITQKSDMEECLRTGSKALEMNTCNDSVLQDFIKCLFNATKLDFAATVPNYKMDFDLQEKKVLESISSSDMEIDESSKPLPRSGSSSSSSTMSHKSKTVKELPQNLSEEDLHKLKCDEFINRMKNIDISKHKHVTQSPKVTYVDVPSLKLTTASKNKYRRERCLVNLVSVANEDDPHQIEKASTSANVSRIHNVYERAKKRIDKPRRRRSKHSRSSSRSRRRSPSSRKIVRYSRSSSSSSSSRYKSSREKSYDSDRNRSPVHDAAKIGLYHKLTPNVNKDNCEGFSTPSYCSTEKESAIEIMKNIFESSN